MASNLSRVLSGMDETVITATNQVITVDPDTRQLNIPGIELVFGVEGDADSERKYFQFPRYVGDNLDLAGSFLRVSYRNANGDKDFSPIDDVALNGDSVVFSWKIHPKVVAYKGQVRFVVCAVGPDLKVKWHTTLGIGISSEGLEPDANLEATEDGVAALIAMVEAQTAAVENKGAEWVRNVQNEGTDQIVAVQTAAEAAESDAVAEIEAKGVNVRESIPDDYTAVQNAVDGLVRSRAGAIVCSVEGSAVAVNDASDMAIQGMKIFGRSTQDGTPTPDAPVEIKSVVEPVVTVAGKNLVNISGDDITWNGITFMMGDNGTVKVNGTATDLSYKNFTVILPKGEYRLTGCPSGGDVNFGYFIRLVSTKLTDNVALTVGDDTGSGLNFTVSETSEITVRLVVRKGKTVDGVVFEPMIRVASSGNDEHEPYKALQTLSTTHTLPGIPVTSGGNYTDSDGQQWICDEVDLERGVYVQRIGTRTVSDANVSSITVEDDGTAVVYRVYLNSPVSGHVGYSDGFCDQYSVRKSYAEMQNFEGFGYAINGSGNLLIRNDSISTSGELLAEFANNPLFLAYQLVTPIETPLSEIEIAAYRALHSNYPNTTVLNDSGAHMVVKYAADTKLYIDNKIAALVSG